MSHVPVLLHEVVEALAPKPGEFIIDGTVDGGGYARAILDRMQGKGRLLGVDWDSTMAEKAEVALDPYRNQTMSIQVVRGNFRELPEILVREKFGRADGLVLDLGFSSEQLEAQGRGFSFGKDEPLLMTYSDAMIPVRELLNKLNKQEIEEIIRTFGEERFARRIARAIKERLQGGTITTSRELSETIRRAVPSGYERGRIHPATRTFQAFRIYANHELENLQGIIDALPSVVRPGARVAVVSFHSLEDRIVKRGFNEIVKKGNALSLTKKPITPARDEIRENPRSRSAKLRAIVLNPKP